MTFLVRRDYVRDHCWLINRTGKPGAFLPYNLGQEEDIKDIKVRCILKLLESLCSHVDDTNRISQYTYHSMGPGATMEYLKKISPAIPTLRKVQRHMERQFNTAARGSRHGIPDKEPDVAKLTVEYTTSELHAHVPGRKIKVAGDRSKDVITDGAIELEKSKTINEWFRKRTHKRSTMEDWSPMEVD